MSKEAKYADKMEKKLEVVLAGHQVCMNNTCLHSNASILSISGTFPRIVRHISSVTRKYVILDPPCELRKWRYNSALILALLDI